MSTYTNLPAPSPEQGLNRYMQEIRKFPLLEPEEGLSPCDLCDVVDQGFDSGIYLALVVFGENGHHLGAEKAVFQPAQG